MAEAGTLYLCATPIGNLEDMSFRAVRVLKEVSLIAAEDTRHTRKLLSHFEIRTPLVSYHEHNKTARGPELVSRLLAGESIAVVSDAGLPGISDPGADLARLALAEGIAVAPVPGPNAALSALICSGLDTRMFLFAGFLPKTAKRRRELLAQLAQIPYTLIFYESPHRLTNTLVELAGAFGDRPTVVGRELTKKYEQFCYGTLSTLRERFSESPPRGEFTLVVAGAAPTEAPAQAEAPPAALWEAVTALMAANVPKKEAIRQVAVERGLSRREVYQSVLAAEADRENG